jgi:DNA-binding NarL/FixJ family response regulator
MKKLEILIADDHVFVRKGLRATLEAQEGWHVCGEADNGRKAVELTQKLSPDLVVMDISMPVLNGLDATGQILKNRSSTEVLILTMHESEPLIAGVMEAGARGIILKSDTSRLLVSAVEALSEHKPFFTGKVSEMMLSLLKPGETTEHSQDLSSRLTPREREITQLIAESKTNKEIATLLGISVKTVDAHRTNIMRRLNVHSVQELVRYAIRNDIIEA